MSDIHSTFNPPLAAAWRRQHDAIIAFHRRDGSWINVETAEADVERVIRNTIASEDMPLNATDQQQAYALIANNQDYPNGLLERVMAAYSILVAQLKAIRENESLYRMENDQFRTKIAELQAKLDAVENTKLANEVVKETLKRIGDGW